MTPPLCIGIRNGKPCRRVGVNAEGLCAICAGDKNAAGLLCGYEFPDGSLCRFYALPGRTRCQNHIHKDIKTRQVNRPMSLDGPNIKDIVPRKMQGEILADINDVLAGRSLAEQERMRAFLADPEITSLVKHLALLDVDIENLNNELSALLEAREVNAADEDFDAAKHDHKIHRKRQEIRETVDLRQKASIAQDRHVQFMQENVARDKVTQYAQVILQAIQLEVTDEIVRDAILAKFASFMTLLDETQRLMFVQLVSNFEVVNNMKLGIRTRVEHSMHLVSHHAQRS